MEVQVLCGSLYNVYEEIEIATTRNSSKIRLARITFKDREDQTQHDVGLILEPLVAEELKRELDRNVVLEKWKETNAGGKAKASGLTLSDFDMFGKK